MEFLRQITIVGTGLLGGSIGLGLKASNVRATVVGVGRSRNTLERALARGCIDVIAEDLAAAAEESQLVILATPLGVFPQRLEELSKIRSDTLVITDVGSAKQRVCDAAAQKLAIPERFVGSHPMAGSEQHGPDHARSDLMRGRPCVITPTPGTSQDAIDIVETLWEILGMHVMSMSPLEHDRKVAHVSHLPHAVASLLVNLAGETNSLDVASTGFVDTTRIASGDPGVWLDIFHNNHEAVSEGIDKLIEQLQAFQQLLDPARKADLMELLETAKETRDRFVESTRREGAERVG